VVNTSTIFWSMPLVRNGMTPIPGHINHGGTWRARGWPQDERVRQMTFNALNRIGRVSSPVRLTPSVRTAVPAAASPRRAVYDLRGSLLEHRTGHIRVRVQGAYVRKADGSVILSVLPPK
jgi:hypothetical protein